MLSTDLLVTNGEFALSLLVGVGEGFEFLDGLALHNLDAELDVALSVLVAGLDSLYQRVFPGGGKSFTYVDLGVVRKSCEGLVQSLVHLLGSAFEETTTACFVSGEHGNS